MFNEDYTVYKHTSKGLIYTIAIDFFPDAFFPVMALDTLNLLACIPVIGLPLAALVGLPMVPLVGLYIYLYPALNTRMNSQIDQVTELERSLPSLPKASNIYVGGLPQITHPNSSIVWLITIFGGWTIIGWILALYLSIRSAIIPVPPLLASLLREYNLKQTSTNAS